MKSKKIYKVKFQVPPIDGDPRTEFFFLNLTDIYKHFTKQQIGCCVNRLWNLKVSKGNRYESRKCSIERVSLMMSNNSTP